LAKVSVKGSVSGLASIPGEVPESAVDVDVAVDVAVLVVVDVGGASLIGVSLLCIDDPSVIAVDVAAPSMVVMAIAVCAEHAL
jgi:hypothetical protein